MSPLMEYQTVSTGGSVTHVIVPVKDFMELTGQGLAALQHPDDDIVRRATEIYNDPNTQWHDAEGIFRKLLSEGIAEVRRAYGLSQAELGERAGMSQSTVSRCEVDPDGISVRMLKKIAEALGQSR